MEFGNSTNHIFEMKSEAGEETVDICGLNPNICGMEAGCYNQGDSYLCLCHDLKPADANNNCDRTESPSSPTSSTDSSVTKVLLQVAPTEGSFGPHQLLGMLSTSKQPPGNLTESNSTLTSEPSHVVPHTSAGFAGLSAVLGTCLFALVLLTICSLILFVYHRRKGTLCWWLSPDRRRNAAAMSLSKCMEQYIANPNYYSTSPDAPLLGMRHLQIPSDNVVLMEEIGEGCFGKVHKGMYTRNDGLMQMVAVKTLKDNFNQDAQTDFEREVEIMSSFSHENILKLEGIVFKENQTCPWMVFEFMQHGDLAQLLRSNSPLSRTQNTEQAVELNESNLIWISSQIANGMMYLSSQHFVHRDLATRNCLVGDHLSVKISDFGMSRDIYTSDYYKVRGSRMLPIRWMAPESITYGKFSLESDVWAFGVVLWEIFTCGKQPYYGHSNDEVVKLILQGILLSTPENCPPFICNVMAGCWKTEPRDRLTFADVYDIISQYTTDTRLEASSPPEYMRMDNDNYLLPTGITVI
ncbi:unnamed protein product [Larinioides sclopetarius]|uniref:Protein kinase domain-containing protein n=1 Tax=Larinioides sclopetarius TaxID=280406 RepID=A0AAV2B036_9ARAC